MELQRSFEIRRDFISPRLCNISEREGCLCPHPPLCLCLCFFLITCVLLEESFVTPSLSENFRFNPVLIGIYLLFAVGKSKIPSDEAAKWKIVLKREMHKRIGMLKWLPQYTKTDALSDFIAGITIGLTIVPQSMAYASLARLPPEVSNLRMYYCGVEMAAY